MNTFGKNAIVSTSLSSSSSSSSNVMPTIAKPATSTTTTTAAVSAFDKQIQKWIELDNKLKKIKAKQKQ